MCVTYSVCHEGTVLILLEVGKTKIMLQDQSEFVQCLHSFWGYHKYSMHPVVLILL